MVDNALALISALKNQMVPSFALEMEPIFLQEVDQIPCFHVFPPSNAHYTRLSAICQEGKYHL